MEYRIRSDSAIVEGTMVLLCAGKFIYVGPIRKQPEQLLIDEMILNPMDEASCLDFIEEHWDEV